MLSSECGYTSMGSQGEVDSTYAIEISIDSPGSEVWMNGELIGTTPMDLSASAGEIYQIEIKEENFISYFTSISMPPGDNVKLDGNLVRITTRERISEYGYSPSWYENDNLCFITDASGIELLCITHFSDKSVNLEFQD